MQFNKRQWLHLRYAIVFLLTSFATTSASAQALETLSAESDVVAIGTVVASEVSALGPNGRFGIHTRVELEVEVTIAAASSARLEFWVQGGTLGDRRRVLTGQATFAVGERVAVFLSSTRDGVLFPTRMALGKWRVEGTPGSERVVPPAADPHARAAPLDSLAPVSRHEFLRRARLAKVER